VVDIMVDHSGSMRGPKLALASQTCIVLGEVLNLLGIPFSVRGFSTGDPYVAARRNGNASKDERQMFSRWGDHWIGVYKDYNEPWAHAGPRVINMIRNEQSNTYDGESLRFSAQCLAARKEKRKILFWLNDGEPCPNSGDDHTAHAQFAKDCAKEVEKSVELIAIGIMTDAVKNFYTNYIVVKDLKTLPAVCLTELDALLRKGKTLKQAV
jgi:cobalamin biosynthesis protein CobT